MRILPAAPSRPPLLRYGAAIALVGLALGVKFALVPLVEQETPFLLFFGAVLVASWYGGMGPGLVATALAALASNYFFMVPFYRFELATAAERFRLGVFVAEGTFISAFGAALQAARRRAVASADEARHLRRRAVEAGEQEMRRIGRDLHDGLGQLLTGTAFLARALSVQLAEASADRAADARRIEGNVNQAVRWTRDLAAALAPVSLESQGLEAALLELASRTSEMFGVSCEFQTTAPADRGSGAPTANRIKGISAARANHLYRIAQEAVSNAVRHGKARHVRLRLASNDAGLLMLIEDDGIGFDPAAPPQGDGIGVRTMTDRARIIGGTLTFAPAPGGGTAVVCICGRAPPLSGDLRDG